MSSPKCNHNNQWYNIAFTQNISCESISIKVYKSFYNFLSHAPVPMLSNFKRIVNYQSFISLTNHNNQPTTSINHWCAFFPRSKLIFVHKNISIFQGVNFHLQYVCFVVLSDQYHSASTYAQIELGVYLNGRHIEFIVFMMGLGKLILSTKSILVLDVSHRQSSYRWPGLHFQTVDILTSIIPSHIRLLIGLAFVK